MTRVCLRRMMKHGLLVMKACLLQACAFLERAKVF